MTETALVTGATSGIGRAIANKLAELGIHVLVVGRNKERGEEAIAAIRAAGGQADFIQSDLQDASSARSVARTEGTALLGEGLEQLAAQAPAGRPAKVEEIAEAIIFLATDRASFIQGAKLAVDGGRTAV
jgi:NAD(P)-dependent dehydrogenase (short-subunit alcohol dehydrogenase family)